MKDKFLKMAGVKSEKEFYKMFPTEEAFFKAYPQAVEMKKGGNVPTNPELYSRVKSEAKSKFDRWPSAYGSAWLVKTYKSRGGGYRKAQTGGGLQDQEIFQYPTYDSNMLAYAKQAREDEKNNLMNPIGDFMSNAAFAAGTAMDNAQANGEDNTDKMQMAKLAMSVMGMPAMQMGGVGMMMRDNYYDEGGEMAMGQVMAMNDKIARLQNFINANSEIEPWVASKLTLADDYLTSVSDYLQFNEGDEEEEEDTDLTMGELEEMKNGGIPERYRSRGFTKVGVKRQSNRPGKKWMVLAKKGDKYKIVHGGYKGMKDFSQHGSEKRKKNFWNRMGGKDSSKATDPFSPLYWHKRFGTWAEGGDVSDAPINTFMSPGLDNDPRFEQYYNQQIQNFNKSGIKEIPSRNDIYSYYQSSNPASAVDQTGRMMFSNPQGNISSSTTFSQAVDPTTGKVLNQGTNLAKSAFDRQAQRFEYGGNPVQKADPMQPIIDAERKAKQRDVLKTAAIATGALGATAFDAIRQYQKQLGYSKWQAENKDAYNEGTPIPSNKELRKMGRRANGGEPTNAGFQALPDYVQNKIMSNMAYGGYMPEMGVGGKMPVEIARARFAAAGNLDKLDDYGYAYGGDVYGGQIDMDAMYQMMKKGGSTFSGNAWYQDGGQGQDPVMQAIQMYAQMTEMDPEQLMQQLQALPPLEQQEAIQKIMQAIQQSQEESSEMAYGGININPANKGKFTASANRAGMGVQEFASKVLANKEDYSSTQVKRANFAKNAAKWKKQMGGMTQGAELELHPDEIQSLIDQGYGIEYLD
jgi:hypothetical protein